MKRASILGAVSAVTIIFPVAALIEILYQVAHAGRLPTFTELYILLGFLFVVGVSGGFLVMAAAGAGIAAAAFALVRFMSASLATRPATVYAIAVMAGSAVGLAVLIAIANMTWAPGGAR
jgi:hypothetical protein